MARYRKALVAAVMVLAQVVSLGVAHGAVQSWLVCVLAVAGAFGVYAVPNARAVDADPPA